MLLLLLLLLLLQVYLLLSCCPCEGRISGIVDVPNAGTGLKST
jgi:acetamidase/formamidase